MSLSGCRDTESHTPDTDPVPYNLMNSDLCVIRVRVFRVHKGITSDFFLRLFLSKPDALFPLLAFLPEPNSESWHPGRHWPALCPEPAHVPNPDLRRLITCSGGTPTAANGLVRENNRQTCTSGLCPACSPAGVAAAPWLRLSSADRRDPVGHAEKLVFSQSHLQKPKHDHPLRTDLVYFKPMASRKRRGHG